MSWITRTQERLSDSVHATNDAFARQTGWSTTRTAWRSGLGTRLFRDPQFGQRRTEASTAAAQPTGAPR